MAFMSGNLCYQIEHHLFPDLPSNRYAEIAERVRALCDKYDLPVHHGILCAAVHADVLDDRQARAARQVLKATSDDAPETHSELKFRIRDGLRESFVDPGTGKRRGLRTALRELRAGVTGPLRPFRYALQFIDHWTGLCSTGGVLRMSAVVSIPRYPARSPPSGCPAP